MSSISSNGENLGRDCKVTDLLRRDHIRIQEMFSAYNLLRGNKEKKLTVDKILEELQIHTTVEEELVYPLARAISFDDNIRVFMDEAEAEHQIAKDVMADLASMKPADDSYDAKVAGLFVVTKHHMNEEENEMFSEIRDSGIDLEELGAQVLLRKEELMNSAVSKNIENLETDLDQFRAL
jgi:signal recognition particle subunit SEC65